MNERERKLRKALKFYADCEVMMWWQDKGKIAREMLFLTQEPAGEGEEKRSEWSPSTVNTTGSYCGIPTPEPSTTEGEREESNDILEEWGMADASRGPEEYWNEPWCYLPEGARSLLVIISVDVAQQRNDNAARTLALLTEPTEQGERIAMLESEVTNLRTQLGMAKATEAGLRQHKQDIESGGR